MKIRKEKQQTWEDFRNVGEQKFKDSDKEFWLTIKRLQYKEGTVISSIKTKILIN